MGDIETSGGHHQSVICRARYDASPTATDPSQQRLTTVAGLYDSGHEASADNVRRQSTIHDSAVYEYHRRLKAAAAASQAMIPAVYPSQYVASQVDQAAGSSPTDEEEVDDRYPAAPRQQTGARAYYRAAAGCAAAGQRRLQHHAPTESHVTGYTSVIVDTQQLHANGYVH